MIRSATVLSTFAVRSRTQVNSSCAKRVTLHANANGTLGTVASPEAADYIYAAYDFDDPQGGTWQQ